MLFANDNSKNRFSNSISICLLIMICFADFVFAQDTQKTEANIISRNRDDYRLGRIEGKIEASRSYGADSWVAAGWGSGFILNVVGIGIIAGVSQHGRVYPEEELMLSLNNRSVAYQDGYLRGFSEKAKKKRLFKTIVGGFFGIAFSVALYSAIVENGH